MIKELLDGNQAAAYAAKLARVKCFPCFPITPQTELIEILAEWKTNNQIDLEYNLVDSEHSVLSAAVGSEMTGARTFTATSSQGLMLMHEILPIASGCRLPIVMLNVSRALSSPISLWCFDGEEEVLMADLTYKKIKDIIVGDEVLGIKRKYGGGDIVKSKVKKTFIRKTDNLIKLKTTNFDIICTPDHKFYYHPIHNRWIRAKFLKSKNLKWFGYNNKINREYKRGYMAGVADGDGCFSYTHNKKYLRFEIHAKDKEMINTLIQYSKELGFNIRPHAYKKKYNQYGAILTRHKEAKRFIKYLKKKMNIDFCRGYLAGIYDSDGTGPYKKTGSLVIYNKNPKIVKFTCSCLKKLNINYKTYKGKGATQINVNNKPKFFIYCQPKIERKLKNLYHNTFKAIKDKLKIDKIVNIKGSKRVYNIETETNNYIVKGFLVHNCDHNDILAMRDSGWLIFVSETNQEVLDSIIIAFKVSENKRVLLPSLVNMDGFIHSYTRTQVEIPDQKVVDKFLPRLNLKVKLDVKNPMTLGTPSMHYYMYFKSQQHKTQLDSLKIIKQAQEEWYKLTKRKYLVVEPYYLNDAKAAIVIMGASTTIARAAVDNLRKKRIKVGLLRIRLLRPFPEEDIKKALSGIKKIAVLDQNIAPGLSGILYPEIKAALYNQKDKPIISNYIFSLGGKPTSQKEFEEIFKEILSSNKEQRKWLL